MDGRDSDASRPFLTAHWSNVVLLTFEAPDDLVRTQLAPVVAPDRWDGTRHARLVAPARGDVRPLSHGAYARLPRRSARPGAGLPGNAPTVGCENNRQRGLCGGLRGAVRARVAILEPRETRFHRPGSGIGRRGLSASPYGFHQ